MNCVQCEKSPVFKSPHLCKEHFISYFEEKVEKTIAEHQLLKKSDSVGVATSGGKDSMTLLSLLHKFGYAVHALLIDEDIAEYRDETRETAEDFCKQNRIPFTVVSFNEEMGAPLDDILKKKKFHPCSICGTFRRTLLHRHAKKLNFDVVATGHNADDEAQAILMNLTRANIDLLPRLGPRTTSNADFLPRVKPLYFCTEKEIMTYAVLQKLASKFTECPYASQAYRSNIREFLNTYEVSHLGAKQRILAHFLKIKDSLLVTPTTIMKCEKCSEPSHGNICKACRFLVEITEQNH